MEDQNSSSLDGEQDAPDDEQDRLDDEQDAADDEQDAADDELDDDINLAIDDDDDEDLATVAVGATIDEAKKKALEQLRKIAAYVNEADVEFITVDEGQKGGFLGMGKTQPRVEARLHSSGAPVDSGLPPVAGILQDFLEGVVARMGFEATVEASESGDAVTAQISGDDLAILIGRHGQTIDALQYLAAIVVNRDRHDRRQVVVDAEGYRQRRESALKALADRTAQKVSRESAQVALNPMSAGERKIVHLHLKDHPRVETASEGQEPYRAVVILPKRRGG
jgi:spoIIIJ-associated protein